jgi:hypothetical protein
MASQVISFSRRACPPLVPLGGAGDKPAGQMDCQKSIAVTGYLWVEPTPCSQSIPPPPGTGVRATIVVDTPCNCRNKVMLAISDSVCRGPSAPPASEHFCLPICSLGTGRTIPSLQRFYAVEMFPSEHFRHPER